MLKADAVAGDAPDGDDLFVVGEEFGVVRAVGKVKGDLRGVVTFESSPPGSVTIEAYHNAPSDGDGANEEVDELPVRNRQPFGLPRAVRQ